MTGSLKDAINRLGKDSWRPMLRYVADLHEACTHPPEQWFAYPWEEIGTGYCYREAFGHWDIIHQVLDILPHEAEHAGHQLRNYLCMQQDDGMFVATLCMRDETGTIQRKGFGRGKVTHPPVWVVAAEQYMQVRQSDEFLAESYDAARKQIAWFKANRQAEPEGFFYTDILNHSWESGVDEGVRFDKVATGPLPCVDATSHVYLLLDHACRWGERLGQDIADMHVERDRLRVFIQEGLFDTDDGAFYDSWMISDPTLRHQVHEMIWPVVVGAATPEQAQSVINRYLLDEDVFLTEHPIPTIGRTDPAFELRMWRGPAWNSITYWGATGCLRYGRPDAAAVLLERAMDSSSKQFERTGTIWEFYHSLGGNPEDVQRKPHTPFDTPCRDYLGHNPLCAMAQAWQACRV